MTDESESQTVRPRCDLCHYWDFFSDVGRNAEGLCRRYPPTSTSFTGDWPATADSDWCGEFREQQEDDEQSVVFVESN